MSTPFIFLPSHEFGGVYDVHGWIILASPTRHNVCQKMVFIAMRSFALHQSLLYAIITENRLLSFDFFVNELEKCRNLKLSYIRLLSFYTPHDLFMQHKLLNQYTIRFHNFHMFNLQVKPL